MHGVVGRGWAEEEEEQAPKSLLMRVVWIWMLDRAA